MPARASASSAKRRAHSVAALAVEPRLAAVDDDLEAIAVELRLMEPGIVLRDGLCGGGDAGTDELRCHAQDLGEFSG